uniref:Ovule protein n=1 Tax=Gongylonema pulchrum TaxID=637853 RepID=A0A183EZY4_9BILA
LGESVIYDELEEQSKQTGITNQSLLSRRFSARGTKKKVVANRFRPVIYSEGELENSDLSQPPSRSFSVAFRSRGFYREGFLPNMKLFVFLICIRK